MSTTLCARQQFVNNQKKLFVYRGRWKHNCCMVNQMPYRLAPVGRRGRNSLWDTQFWPLHTHNPAYPL